MKTRRKSRIKNTHRYPSLTQVNRDAHRRPKQSQSNIDRRANVDKSIWLKWTRRPQYAEELRTQHYRDPMRTLLVAFVLALSTVPVLVTDNGNKNTHRHPQKETVT